MTDARRLLEQMQAEEMAEYNETGTWLNGWDTPSGKALIAAAAEADTLRSRVAALEGVLRRLASWDEMAGHGDPSEFPAWYSEFPAWYRAEVGARIGLAKAALAPTPATDEARCGYPGCGRGRANMRHLRHEEKRYGHLHYGTESACHPFTPQPTPTLEPAP